MRVSSGLSALALCFIVYVSAESVPIPEDVRVKSLDMGLVLEWDPPQNASNKVFNYTAEVKAWSGYDPVCVRSSSLSCDFTNDISTFGAYVLRVRTELHGESSEWVETVEVAVDKITEISAPRVELRSRNGQTEVDVTDPPMRKRNLRDVFRHISYLIRYWSKGEAKKEELVRDQNRVMLPDLEPLVNYCVEVAVLYLNKTSHFSNVTCVTNSASNEAHPGLLAAVVVVSFLVVLVSVVLIFLAVWYSHKMCRIIFPDPKLPENLKQFLSQQSQSPVLSAMQESAQLKEHFNELRIFQKEVDGSKDGPQTEGSLGIHTDKEECVEADVEQSSGGSTSEEKNYLLTGLSL